MNKVEIKTLKSGIRVIIEKMDHVKSASFGAWVKAGAIYEEPEISGVSHFIEHMMFKGTSNRTYKEIASDIDKIGGQINAFTGKEATCYYVKSIGTNLKSAIDVIIDMLENSVFDKTEMNKERKVIVEELNMTYDTPDDLANEIFNELVYKNNTYGKSIIGTKTSLKNINRDKLVAYKDREYTRDSIIFSIAGNFDEKEILDFLDEKLLNFKESKDEFNYVLPEYVPKFKVVKKDIAQTHICLGLKGVSIKDDRYYAINILNSVLGGSMSSRLFQNIREEKGLCYTVFSSSQSFLNDGSFMIYTGVNSDKIDLAISGIKEELETLNKYGITEEELSMAKEQAKSTYIFGQENVATRMFVNGKNLIRENKYFSTEEIINDIDNVKMDDIMNVKSIICNLDKYSGSSVSDRKFDLKKLWDK